jgi:hypothetical protein
LDLAVVGKEAAMNPLFDEVLELVEPLLRFVARAYRDPRSVQLVDLVNRVTVDDHRDAVRSELRRLAKPEGFVDRDRDFSERVRRYRSRVRRFDTALNNVVFTAGVDFPGLQQADELPEVLADAVRRWLQANVAVVIDDIVLIVNAVSAEGDSRARRATQRLIAQYRPLVGSLAAEITAFDEKRRQLAARFRDGLFTWEPRYAAAINGALVGALEQARKSLGVSDDERRRAGALAALIRKVEDRGFEVGNVLATTAGKRSAEVPELALHQALTRAAFVYKEVRIGDGLVREAGVDLRDLLSARGALNGFLAELVRGLAAFGEELRPEVLDTDASPRVEIGELGRIEGLAVSYVPFLQGREALRAAFEEAVRDEDAVVVALRDARTRVEEALRALDKTAVELDAAVVERAQLSAARTECENHLLCATVIERLEAAGERRDEFRRYKAIERGALRPNREALDVLLLERAELRAGRTLGPTARARVEEIDREREERLPVIRGDERTLGGLRDALDLVGRGRTLEQRADERLQRARADHTRAQDEVDDAFEALSDATLARADAVDRRRQAFLAYEAHRAQGGPMVQAVQVQSAGESEVVFFAESGDLTAVIDGLQQQRRILRDLLGEAADNTVKCERACRELAEASLGAHAELARDQLLSGGAQIVVESAFLAIDIAKAARRGGLFGVLALLIEEFVVAAWFPPFTVVDAVPDVEATLARIPEAGEVFEAAQENGFQSVLSPPIQALDALAEARFRQFRLDEALRTVIEGGDVDAARLASRLARNPDIYFDPVRATADVRQRLQELRESQRRLTDTVDSLPGAPGRGYLGQLKNALKVGIDAATGTVQDSLRDALKQKVADLVERPAMEAAIVAQARASAAAILWIAAASTQQRIDDRLAAVDRLLDRLLAANLPAEGLVVLDQRPFRRGPELIVQVATPAPDTLRLGVRLGTRDATDDGTFTLLTRLADELPGVVGASGTGFQPTDVIPTFPGGTALATVRLRIDTRSGTGPAFRGGMLVVDVVS